MPIQIVHEYPAPAGPLRRLAKRLAFVLGGLLVLAGLLASPVPILYLFGIILMLTGQIPAALDLQPAIVSAAVVACVIVGLRLVRGKRQLVLFLRRFGFVGATQAVTFAVVGALGTSWRLVTLDDARVSPVGARKRMRWLSISVGLVATALVASLAFWTFGGGMAGFLSEPAGRVMHGATFGDFFGRLAAAALVWFFLMLLVLALLSIVVAFVAALAIFAWSSYRAIRRAERGKTVEIAEQARIEQTTAEVLRRSHGIIGPRLAVARVASPIWQPVVRRFASISSVAIIDISEPSENLLWEIETLRPEMRLHWIFVGEQEHLQRITVRAAQEPKSSPEGRLWQILDAEQVLAYSGDQQDLPRFARSLQARLETLSSAVTRS